MSKEKMEPKGSAPQQPADRSAILLELFTTAPGQRFTLKNLAAASGGADREGKLQTDQIVSQLVAQGLVEACAGKKYRLGKHCMPAYVGVADMVSTGSIYVTVEGLEDDIFVHFRNTHRALNGDVVKVVVTHTGKGGAPEGKIVEVVERNRKSYVGTAEVGANQIFVRIDSRKMPLDVYLSKHAYPDLQDGEKVLVRIVDWAEGMKSPQGELIERLGRSGEHETEMHAILAEYDLPYKFEKEVEQAAETIPGQITARDYAERRDFRTVTTFTIDPADAKDFDDALSIRKVSEGLWEVGVHIADVTHYVRPGSVVDTEGEARATSVYLVDRTVPMLPERLSNELCSLRPHEESLCFSAVFTIDERLEILSEWFGRTVIYSDRRFSYEEAQQVIETGEGDLKEEILTLHRLAQGLRAQRFRNGAISFERKEAKFQLAPDGKPLGVYFKEQKAANQLIEEFMLLANRKVAEFIGKRQGKAGRRTMVYRVHDEPNTEKLDRFRNFVLRFGYYFKADKGKAIAKEINQLMGQVRGKPEENVISTLAVRTMAKAYYTTDNIGHYGLAFPYYTHFTSPIRRYPDMMVHRLLANYLAGGKSPDKALYEKFCEHSSEREVLAAEAERASVKYKMVEFMAERLGEEFDGHISGVTEWGVYVELDDTHIEGMVSLREMPDDYYQYDETLYAVVGRSTGSVLTLGDAVRIRVKRADLAKKQLDFEMVSATDLRSGRHTVIEPPRIPAHGVDPRRSARRGRKGRR